ncbi:glycosyltransferase family 4 protein (plasmid) [Bradyrhizobium sp. ISRA443]|uniref:glycosyltransferase family 4 protein n=1 Tax=unclassified Bradyrhizobium TaxID=2631580 RepID=UPI00247B1F29|nr:MULTISPECIES: glycosyltransferase family 1 protein [unclassified Bradyrhizobium]WGS03078.1 glycosyltransferase family 4 protein [Bradyrhizobium sp. ISRA436]WGS09888.1 glycosyltransferase family 4 protein [Bradyrhizobium sp. ISRA437]WGS16773.1 glycosyltransferase family 4 protein [Bradyrhizobium sp. ISRA443]
MAVDGGGYTLLNCLMEAVKSVSTSHTFVIIGDALVARDKNSGKSGWLEIVKPAAKAIGAMPLARQLRHWQRRAASPLVADSSWDRLLRGAEVDIAWLLGTDDPVSVPYVMTVWDLQHRLQPYFPEVSTSGWDWQARERHYQRCLPRASRIITGTEVGKQEVTRFYGVAPDNIAVIPLPAPQLAASRESGARMRDKYGIDGEFILYPAQFWPHKNHINLLLALERIKREAGLALRLVLTGSDKGNLGYVRETVSALGLAAQVDILGFIPMADLSGLYQEALVLAFPSFFGPDNLPPLEAFALRCPVVAARVAGAEEQLGEAALFFDPADPQDIARAILQIHHDRALRSQLIERGARLAAERTPRAYVERVCRLLDDFVPIRRCWRHDYVHS